MALTTCAATPPTGSASLSPASSKAELASQNPIPGDFNPVESTLGNALMDLGISAQRAEHSFRGAFFWSEFDDGSALYVSGYPADIPAGDFAVVDEREVGGLRIQSVRYESGIVRDRFQCAELNVEVEGATPPDYADMDAFLDEFVAALGCGD